MAQGAQAPRNRVRIVGGEWRSRVVTFIPRPDLRPTPDRVRETLFNWLGQDLSGRACLDLFAGSGALGFEAGSRGAREVALVERDARAYGALEAAAAQLDPQGAVLKPVRGDALQFLARAGGRYDVVFLDPPFRSGLQAQVLSQLPPRLAPGALVYLEAPSTPVLPAGWNVWRHGRAGTVHYQLLTWSGTAS